MKKLLNDIKKLHVNYEVLAAGVLHLSEQEQVKVNNLIIKSLGLPVRATADSIQRERQIKVDDVSEYDAILDAFLLLEKVTARLKIVDGSCEQVAEAQMFLAGIKDDK